MVLVFTLISSTFDKWLCKLITGMSRSHDITIPSYQWTATCHLTLPLPLSPLATTNSLLLVPSPPLHILAPPVHPQGYFIAFSPFGGKGKRKSWLVFDFDVYFQSLLPFLAKFEILSKLLTILEIANLELDLKLISKWLRKSHFSFPDVVVFLASSDFHHVLMWKSFNF